MFYLPKKTFALVLGLLLCMCLVAQKKRNSLPILDPCSLDSSCTKDPTYKFFEKEQLWAYCNAPRGGERLSDILNRTLLEQTIANVDSSLNNRPNSLNIKRGTGKKKVDKILNTAIHAKLPTCYEDPKIYFLLQDFFKKVEKARKQLSLPLKILPKYGSLPNSEINAYTYPPDTSSSSLNKRGSIIGFNTELFMFAYQMTKITIPTIGVTNNIEKGKVEVDPTKDAAIEFIETNQDLKVNFCMALLEFMQMVDPSTQPIDEKYDRDLISFVMAIELFAVAHEYGHLIKGHSLEGTKNLRLGLTQSGANQELLVGVRSWQQELEADEVGVRLLIQVLKNEISEEPSSQLRKTLQLTQISNLYAPLFFFKSCDIIDRAKFIRDSAKVMPNPTNEERDFVYAFAEGKATKGQMNEFSRYKEINHPPAWLRIERATKIINSYLKQGSFSKDAIDYSAIGRGLYRNLEVLWGLSLPRLPEIISIVNHKVIPDKIGYTISPDYWDRTFIYNPDLIESITTFYTDGTSDTDILGQYHKAIKTDWILLSGIQVGWAKEAVNSADIKRRKDGLAILALSGDIQLVDYLSSLNTTTWVISEQKYLDKAISFLKRNGRNVSVQKLLKIDPINFSLYDLLSYPCAEGKYDSTFLKLIPAKPTSEIINFIRTHKAVNIKGSLSAMALYMITANTSLASSYGFWTDLLLKSGNLDFAYNFALAGITKNGPNADLENDIGNILTEKGELKTAILHYENSLKLGRVDGWPELNMAKNYSNLNDLDQAEKWFRMAISRDTTARSMDEYAEYLNEFAWFFVTHFPSDSNRMKEALTFSYASNKIMQFSDPNFMDTLAECLALNGDKKSAIDLYERMVEKLPKDSPEYIKYKKQLSQFKSKYSH